jgi:hypothetical protein
MIIPLLCQGGRIMLKKEANYVLVVLIFIIAQAGMMTHVVRVYSQQTITPLSVAQTGLEKLNVLISAKKLGQDWADTFSKATVSMRDTKGFTEYVLIFTSASGSPRTVTLYYNLSGGYSGSSLDD